MCMKPILRYALQGHFHRNGAYAMECSFRDGCGFVKWESDLKSILLLLSYTFWNLQVKMQPQQSAASSSNPPSFSPDIKGKHVQKLSYFPNSLPLGHVQLYAAAAAAAVGRPCSIWVGGAKKPPRRPIAGIAFDRPTTLHTNHPGGRAVPVMGQQPTTLPWNGPVNPEPAMSNAQGERPFIRGER